jgi:hypothetical protein
LQKNADSRVNISEKQFHLMADKKNEERNQTKVIFELWSKWSINAKLDGFLRLGFGHFGAKKSKLQKSKSEKCLSQSL